MTARAADLVVGTAGHVDHGKTTLVRALTGRDLDALPEEKARGITIALGFAPLDLPDGRRVALVDVPGHERLVRTMVAGATGLDAVLLCVSAVDGVMPQTREHLAILGLLGVSRGAVVLTHADLVDEELLALASDDVADLTRGTFLEGAPVVPFEAPSGRGRDDVVAAIAALIREERPAVGPFRLPVDRSFVRPGFGVVVTGTVWSGALTDGASVRLLPDGGTARVRGIQVHGEASGMARAGWRVALNLAGVDRGEVARGTLVTDGPVPTPRVLDVRYQHLGPGPLDDGAPVRLLIGTSEAVGRLHLAEDRDQVAEGTASWAQVRLDAPVPALPGDRFVIRRPSPEETLGGGVVLDPWAPRLRRKERARVGRELARLAKGDATVWLERAGEAGLTPSEWAFRAPGAPRGVPLGDRVLAPTVVARLEGELLVAVDTFHRESPLAMGANRRELRRGRLAGLTERVFDGLVARLVDHRQIVVEGPLLRLARFAVTLGPEQAALRARIRAAFDDAGLAGRSAKALAEGLPDPQTIALTHLLERDGTITAVPGIGWVSSAALVGLRDALRGWFADHDLLQPGDLKETTGLSRKAAIPLLEWLDAQRWTQRRVDARSRGPAL